MFATAFVLPNRAAHAEDGNNASSDKSIALTLDVNGKDATYNNLLEDVSYSGGGISDATNSTIALNGQSLSRRVISSTAAVDGYDAERSHLQIRRRIDQKPQLQDRRADPSRHGQYQSHSKSSRSYRSR